MPCLRQRALAERRRDVGALDLLEADRERTGLQDERKVLRLLEAAALAEVDLGVRARDAVRVVLQLAALRLFTRDLLELARAVVRELEEHDRLARLAEVRARPREDEVATGHLRDGV